MDFGIDGSTAWKIWLDGWTYGHIARKTEKLIRTLYEGRPPECPIFGGPCIGRLECVQHTNQPDCGQ